MNPDAQAALATKAAGITAGGPTGATPASFSFEVEPLTVAGRLAHVLGGLVNTAVIAVGINFLLVNSGDLVSNALPAVCLGVLAGTFIADFVSGVMHWAFDSWFRQDTIGLRRMVVLVREHHVYPDRIFNYSFWHDAGMLSWFAAGASAPLLGFATLAPGAPGPAQVAFAAAGVTLSLEIVFMFEFHKCGHRVDRGGGVRLLQRLHVLLSPEHHLAHHRGRHDTNYCLITGIADRTLGRLGAFRLLEHLVQAVTGAVAREDDREWMRRHVTRAS